MNDKQKADFVVAVIAEGDQVRAEQRQILRDMPDEVLTALWTLAQDEGDRGPTSLQFVLSLGCIEIGFEFARRAAVAAGLETEE